MPVAADARVIETTGATGPIELADASTAVFAGFAPAGPVREPVHMSSFNQFAQAFGVDGGPFMPSAALAHAVRGFFRNGGDACWVVRLEGVPGVGRFGAAEIELMLTSNAPILAVPDAYGMAGGAGAAIELHRRLAAAADEAGNRFAVIDSPPSLGVSEVVLWRRRTAIDSPSAIVYYPWLDVPALTSGHSVAVPPSGHVIGSWARTDAADGIHQAPTGQSLLGIDVLASPVSATDQRALNREGINCLRTFPGPEPRVWGARTLSDDADWRYLHRRRTYANLLTSIALSTDWVARAPLDDTTLDRLQAEVSTFLQAAWRRGALQGAAAGQAFSLRCFPSDERTGHITLELGLALRHPAEFRVTRLILRAGAIPHEPEPEPA